jgi:hypothetical protein
VVQRRMVEGSMAPGSKPSTGEKDGGSSRER